MMSFTQSQKGNVLAQVLVGIVIVAAFFLFCFWYLDKQTPSSGPAPVETPIDTETPLDPDPNPVEPDPVVDPDPIPDPDPDPDPDPVIDPEPVNLVDENGDVFSYLPVGDLIPGSGPGLVDDIVYRPNLLFPAEDRVYLNSQQYRHGGVFGIDHGFNGGRCDAENYQYPWQDTFCEKRTRSQPLCPGGGHEGLDIRPATCTKDVHWAVSVDDGIVTDVQRHWVTIQSPDGNFYNYLHLNMADLSVVEGQTISRGDRIGRISNDYFKSNGTRVFTTTHLHFEMYDNYVAEPGEDPIFTKVNPYMTLVEAYDRKLRGEE